MIKLLDFALIYELTKCMKTMLAGTVFMAGIWGVRKYNRGRVPLADYYALLFLPLALFCGMSRAFYMPYLFFVNEVLYKFCTARAGRLYFCAAFVLFFTYVCKNMYLCRRIRRLPLYGEGALTGRVREKVCAADFTGLGMWYVRRVRVYETKEETSPFSGGLLHPYVVLPERVCRTWSAREIEAVLCHEFLHIRMGHIFWMTVYRLMVCLWWVHPLVYAFEKELHEVMEHVCDERAMQLSGVDREAYGQLLLRLVRLLGKQAPQGSAAFFKSSDFQTLRQRIAALGKEGISVPRRRRMAVCAPVLAVLASALLLLTSYPRYTKITEMALYDEDLQMLAFDTKELRDAVRVKDERLLVEPEKFSALMDELDISGEYVYLSYGGIMKVPGVGGGGDAGMISVSDCTDIFYLRADTWENDMMEFVVKFL